MTRPSQTGRFPCWKVAYLALLESWSVGLSLRWEGGDLADLILNGEFDTVRIRDCRGFTASRTGSPHYLRRSVTVTYAEILNQPRSSSSRKNEFRILSPASLGLATNCSIRGGKVRQAVTDTFASSSNDFQTCRGTGSKSMSGLLGALLRPIDRRKRFVLDPNRSSRLKGL